MLVLPLAAGACAGSGQAGDPGAYPDRAQERLYRYGRLGGDNGLVGFDLGALAQGASPADLGVNPTLWRAALDTIAFMPITSADPRSGVILTDWYAQPGSSTERFKVDILVRGTDFTPGNLHVSVFRQIRAGGSGWRDAPVSDGVADTLARSVLTHAHLGHDGGVG